ncbi:MAG: hypothetical protein OHK0039_06660 [Bacteroidia bacterium]
MSEMEEQDLELIEAYLSGRLDAEARAGVEQRQAQDAAFARQLLIWQESRQALAPAREAFGQLLAGVVAAEEGAQVRDLRRRRWRYTLAAAVAILLLIAGLSWYALRPEGQVYERLYASHFSAPPSPFVLRGAGADSLLGAGAAAYEAGDYAGAYRLWTAVGDHPRAAELQLYRGICLLATGSAAAAVPLLQAAAADPQVAPSARWYLALALLRQGQTDPARVLLQDLAQRQGGLAARAQALLDDMGAAP